MKFLCDQMFSSLGKWLRTAGYDTTIITVSMDDEKILEMALREHRQLLTRDRHFLSMNNNHPVVFLSGNEIEEWVAELNKALKLNWLLAPLSRCIECNTLLAVPDEKIIAAKAPQDVRERTNEFSYCPRCEKVYWKGSHTKRMLDKLTGWQNI